MAIVGYDRPLELLELPRPEPPPGSALVEVLACGMCFTDVKTIRGRMPFSGDLRLPHVPGHEISGRIVEANGEGSRHRAGDHVVVFHSWGCRQCPACRSGHDNLCRQPRGWVGFTDPGGFQEYLVVPVEHLLAVPDGVSPTNACPLTCAIGTAYRAVVVRAGVRPGERVVVLGLGGVGIHAAQVAKAAGAQVLGIDLALDKLAAARGVGLTDLALAAELDRAVADLTDGEGADVLIETTGDPSLVERCRQVGRPGTRIVGVGYRVGDMIPLLSDQFILWENSFLGSRYATHADMDQALRLVARGLVTPVVGGVYPLERANDALRRLEDGQAVGRLVLSVAGPA
ncbi:MAG: alcohol dehydrogenase catalytic domain-containing protein [Acidimicrobiales bacterium]